MSNEDGSLVLIANGEIYNHKELRSSLKDKHTFNSMSDCEVILHLYEERGLSFLDGLNGMFAIALWDTRRQRLILARDRFGIKPLFYTVSKERILFASEAKALFQYPDCPREFDWPVALEDARYFRPAFSTPQPLSYFKGIVHLSPGTAVVVNTQDGKICERRYWHWPVVSSQEEHSDSRTEEQIVEGYQLLLEDAVKKCLMSDVEYGVFLSGGIDSVSVSAIASEVSKFHSFSVLNLSSLQNGDARAAHRASKLFGLFNHQVVFDWFGHRFTGADWKKLLWLLETPECGFEQLYKYHLHSYAKQMRPQLKVILLGQGSDEFNGGYSVDRTRLLAEEQQNWRGFMELVRSARRRGLLADLHANLETWDSCFAPHRIFSEDFVHSMTGQSFEAPAVELAKYHLWTLAVYNLWHEDRTSSGNGIESRVPFLDHRLVEYTARIPQKHHASLFWDKRLLREAMRGRIPEELRQRPKVPFDQGPDARYTRRMMLSVLLDNNAALLEEAFAPIASRPSIADMDSIQKIVRRVEEDPEGNGIDALLALTNMALLDRMVSTATIQAAHNEAGEPWRVSALPIEDWDKEAEKISLRLAGQSKDINFDAPLAFAPNVYLVKPDGAGATQRTAYLVVDDKVTFTVDEDDASGWLNIMRRIDGVKTTRVLLQETGQTEGQIRKFLEEALEYQVVVIVERSPEVFPALLSAASH